MQSFEEIDRRRAAAGLTRKAVYERAGLHKETWRRLVKGRLSTVRTLHKLNAAVDGLIAERETSNGTS